MALLQLVLFSSRGSLPDRVLAPAPGRYATRSGDPVLTTSTVTTLGWYAVAAMASLTLVGLVLAHFRSRAGKYLSLTVAVFGLLLFPLVIPTLVLGYAFGADVGEPEATFGAIASLVLLILAALVTFRHEHWFSKGPAGRRALRARTEPPPGGRRKRQPRYED